MWTALLFMRSAKVQFDRRHTSPVLLYEWDAVGWDSRTQEKEIGRSKVGLGSKEGRP